MVWDGKSFGSFAEHERDDGTECVLVLNEGQLGEIENAVRYFQGG